MLIDNTLANKALALRDLAAKTLDGTVPTLPRIRRMPDEDIIEHLTQVRGIGVWTVQMMLIFRLGRPDVMPSGDYGVRNARQMTGLLGLADAAPAAFDERHDPGRSGEGREPPGQATLL